MANSDASAPGAEAGGWLDAIGRHARPLAAGVLLVVVVAGVRATASAGAGQTGPWHARVVLLGALTEAALAVLLLALTVIRRRRPFPGQPAAYLRPLLAWVIASAMLAVAVLTVIGQLRLHPTAGARPPRSILPPRLRSPSPPPVHRVRPGVTGADLTYVLYALLALVLLAAIGACVLAIRRRGSADVPAGELADEDEDDGTDLAAAVRSGRSALLRLDDARRAIIACYVAMEDSLAEAGATRAVAETPDELLAKAVVSGLLRDAAAGRLTQLFYEARFSSHALDPATRDEASRALDVISTELRQRHRAGPGAPAPATADAAHSGPAAAGGEAAGGHPPQFGMPR